MHRKDFKTPQPTWQTALCKLTALSSAMNLQAVRYMLGRAQMSTGKVVLQTTLGSMDFMLWSDSFFQCKLNL